MNHLFRELAPISDAAWDEIDGEARRSLKNFLAARRLVDFHGPLGWATDCVPRGRLSHQTSSIEGVTVDARAVRPLIELRAEFQLDRSELDAIERGATDADLELVTQAARLAALAEDDVVFNGHAGSGIAGIMAGTPNSSVTIDPDYSQFPSAVASADAALRAQGVDGPYGLALGPRCYTAVIETTDHGGYPILEHLRLITGGPVVWAPAVDGALVISQRGEDHQLWVGQDWSIGYLDHDANSVTLYLEASLTFVNDTPEAAVALRHE